MAFAPTKRWKMPYFTTSGGFPSRKSPTDFAEEAKKLAAMNRESDRREVGLPGHGGDKRSEQALHHGIHNTAEGGADDHTDCEINRVAPKQKLLESFHRWLHQWIF